jgi:hypothetical protein
MDGLGIEDTEKVFWYLTSLVNVSKVRKLLDRIIKL